MRIVFYECLDVSLPLDIVPSVPFYSPKGRPRLQDVGV